MTRTPDAGYSVIVCEDGTSVKVYDGQDGAPGESATPCTVIDNGNGSKTIGCPDGTYVTVSNGDTGAAGSSCSISKNLDAGTAVVSCTDGTSVTISDGKPGAVSLVVQQEEAPGGNCEFGGVRVLSGVDTNGNGALEPGEVTSTSFFCGNTPPCQSLQGTVTIRNTLDWSQLISSGCAEITGDLIIDVPGVSTLAAPTKLARIGGNLVVENNTSLTAIRFPTLTHVGGFLSILADLGGQSSLTAIEFPVLQSVAGHVGVVRQGQLARVELPGLTSAGGLWLDSNASLQSVAMAALTTVGTAHFANNPNLASVTLPALISATGELTATGNANLGSFSAPMLQSVARLFYLASNPVLTSVTVPSLETVGGGFDFRDNASLAALNVPALASVGAWFVLEQSATLSMLSAPALRTVGGEFRVVNNPALPTCQATGLRDRLLASNGIAGSTTVSGNGAGSCP